MFGVCFSDAGLWVEEVDKKIAEAVLRELDMRKQEYSYRIDGSVWATPVDKPNLVPASDPVKQPRHYNNCRAECIDIIEDLGFGFYLGNALKYLWRCKSKGKTKEDIKKCIFYLQFYLFVHHGGKDPRDG
jgi:hypothetical protein